VTTDLQHIYRAANEDQALAALLDFQAKWAVKYPMIGHSWQRHWQEITPFWQY
jgi:transposase-like protein